MPTEIPCGVESGWHIHPGEEVGYILAGIVQMMIQGQTSLILHAGDPFLMPPGTPHNALDVGPGTGQMLSTYIVETGQPLATFVLDRRPLRPSPDPPPSSPASIHPCWSYGVGGRPVMSTTVGASALLRDQAAAVLRGNDQGRWTKAAPRLYPHQWSWDSAFIAIGWAHVDLRRALTELEELFAAQWATGMVPHIVFRAGPEQPYFPGPEWWDTTVSPAAPAPPLQTTGICQPPVHALALQRIWQLAQQAGPEQQAEIRTRVQTLFPRLVSWHRYLATQRDPEASGLVTTYHPWEGTDNSPRWDRALARITVAELGPYTRLDTRALPDPSQRPTNWDYDRYLGLVGLLRKYRYDDALIYREYPFLIKDVFFSAVLVAANDALLDLADVAEASDEVRGQLTGWRDRGRAGLARRLDPEAGLCFEYDVRTGEDIRLRTFAGFAPLFARTADMSQQAAQLRRLDSGDFCGHPRLRWPLLPSTSPAEPAFEPRNYWRGPVWPVINWLLWRSLHQLGYSARADAIRRDSLTQIAAGEFGEYFEPFTGEQLGSARQSWTAAVALDWLASGR